MSRILTALVRGLAYLILFVGIPTATAATVTHHMLDDTDWTDPQPAKPRPTAKPTPTKPAPPAKPRGTNAPWKLGDCVTPQLRIVPCTPGAMRIVGRVHNPGTQPCTGVPETTQIRHSGTYALCLTNR